MRDFFYQSSIFFGAMTIWTYMIGIKCKEKYGNVLCNPMLISLIIVIIILNVGNIPYETYRAGTDIISALLTPATVSLAIPLYQQLELLKKNSKALLVASIAGAVAGMGSIYVMAKIFQLSHQEYVTLLPKSITTAIGMSVSQELGGIVTITVAAIIVTGLLGNIIVVTLCKVFRITEPVAVGLAIGSASHAMGTAKAMELGEVEGAISSLAIILSGVITVIGASVFANLM